MTKENFETVILISSIFYQGKYIVGKQELPKKLVDELKSLKDSPIKNDDENDEDAMTDSLPDSVSKNYDAVLADNENLSDALAETQEKLQAVESELESQKSKSQAAGEELVRLQAALEEQKDELDATKKALASAKKKSPSKA